LDSIASDKHRIRELCLSQSGRIIDMSLVIMLVSGFFELSAPAVEHAGSWARLSYLVAGSFCLLMALGILQLPSGLPKAAGSYPLIVRTFVPDSDSTGVPNNWRAFSFSADFFLLSGLLSAQYPGMGMRSKSKAFPRHGSAGDPLSVIVCRQTAAGELLTWASV